MMRVSVIKPESSVSSTVRISVIQSESVSQVHIVQVMGSHDPSQSVGPQNTSLPSIPEAELIIVRARASSYELSQAEKSFLQVY
jgi:hypothetical protein